LLDRGLHLGHNARPVLGNHHRADFFNLLKKPKRRGRMKYLSAPERGHPPPRLPIAFDNSVWLKPIGVSFLFYPMAIRRHLWTDGAVPGKMFSRRVALLYLLRV
jgi:hypothetical protein